MAGFSNLGLDQLGEDYQWVPEVGSGNSKVPAFLLNALFGSKDNGFNYEMLPESPSTGLKADKFQIPEGTSFSAINGKGTSFDTGLNATGTGGIGFNPAQRYNMLGNNQSIASGNQPTPLAQAVPPNYQMPNQAATGFEQTMQFLKQQSQKIGNMTFGD